MAEVLGQRFQLTDFDDIFEIHRSAGGAVYSARLKADNSRSFIIKERKISELGRTRDIMNEVNLLCQIDCKHVVRCEGWFFHDRGNQRTLFLVLEYCDGGDLASIIKRYLARHIYMDECLIWSILLQICTGLKHLHEKGIVHRDLKCLNIFCDHVQHSTDGSGHVTDVCIKIGDLGVSRQINHENEMLCTRLGTPLYLSPELVEDSSGYYNEKTDIWSLGVILYELAVLHPPFTSDSIMGLARQILKGEYAPIPSRYSEELRRCVAWLLNKDPAQRPSISQLHRYCVLQSQLSTNSKRGTEQCCDYQIGTGGDGSGEDGARPLRSIATNNSTHTHRDSNGNDNASNGDNNNDDNDDDTASEGSFDSHDIAHNRACGPSLSVNKTCLADNNSDNVLMKKSTNANNREDTHKHTLPSITHSQHSGGGENGRYEKGTGTETLVYNHSREAFGEMTQPKHETATHYQEQRGQLLGAIGEDKDIHAAVYGKQKQKQSDNKVPNDTAAVSIDPPPLPRPLPVQQLHGSDGVRSGKDSRDDACGKKVINSNSKNNSDPGPGAGPGQSRGSGQIMTHLVLILKREANRLRCLKDTLKLHSHSVSNGSSGGAAASSNGDNFRDVDRNKNSNGIVSSDDTSSSSSSSARSSFIAEQARATALQLLIVDSKRRIRVIQKAIAIECGESGISMNTNAVAVAGAPAVDAKQSPGSGPVVSDVADSTLIAESRNLLASIKSKVNGATLDQNDQDECGPADISTVGIRAKDQFPVATVSENNTKRLHTLKRPEIIHNGNQRCPSDGRDRMVDGPRNVVMEDSFLPHIMHHRETQGQESHAKRDAFLLSSGAALDPHSAPGIASAAAVFTRPSTASAVEGLQFQYQRQYQNGRQNRDRGIATAIATAGVTSGDGEARQSNGIRMRPKSGIGCRVQRHEHDIFAPLNGHFS